VARPKFRARILRDQGKYGWSAYSDYFTIYTGNPPSAPSLQLPTNKKIKTDPIIAEHYGDVLLATGKKAEAADAYRKSLQANPENLVVQEKLKKLE